MRRFGMISTENNCAGMVAIALRVGGLGLFAKPPTNRLYQDARTLSDWVEKAAGRIREMNELHDNFQMDILRDPDMRAKGGRPRERTVPTLEEWKKESDKGIAFFARRKDQIEKIDGVIRLYHSLPVDKQWARLGCMHKILWYVYHHLTQKANSDRHLAVLRLAVRVHAAVEDLSKEVDQKNWKLVGPIQQVAELEDSSSEGGVWQIAQ
jgi:hypothetical protein